MTKPTKDNNCWVSPDKVTEVFGSIHPPKCPCVSCIKRRSKVLMNG